MKYIKMLGLSLVAAIAVMAFVGAGTASATVLCTSAPEAGEKCKAGTILEEATLLAEGTDPILKVSATEFILCEKIHLLIKATGVGTVSTTNTLTWPSTCKAKVSGCSESATVKTPGTPSGQVLWANNTNGGTFEATLVNPLTEVTLTCGIKVTCKYAASKTIVAKGNNNEHNADVNQALESPGFPCPAGTEEAKTKVKLVSGKLVGGGVVGEGNVFVGKE